MVEKYVGFMSGKPNYIAKRTKELESRGYTVVTVKQWCDGSVTCKYYVLEDERKTA